jgi:hypothetical protein
MYYSLSSKQTSKCDPAVLVIADFKNGQAMSKFEGRLWHYIKTNCQQYKCGDRLKRHGKIMDLCQREYFHEIAENPSILDVPFHITSNTFVFCPHSILATDLQSLVNRYLVLDFFVLIP